MLRRGSQETAKTSLQYQWVAQRVQDPDDVSNSGGHQIEAQGLRLLLQVFQGPRLELLFVLRLRLRL